jgi:hypothetical protein
MSGVEAGHDTTIRRTWREIEKLSFDFNNVVAHGKAYAVIQMLEEVIGKDTFFALVKTVLARYRNRYLSFEDFERVTEEISGQKLGWFFRDWVDGNKTLSYAVEAVEQTGGEARVTVRRTGTAGMPLELELVLADGTRQRRRIARETELQTITFPAKARVRQARLDPDQRMALYSPGGEHVWNIPLDPQFRQRAMAHVEHLAGLGQRVAGTEGETEAIQYIRAEMEKAGLRVAVEPFTFQSYRLDKAVLRMAEDAAEAAELGFDPYGPAGIQGEAVFLDPAVVNDPRQLSKAGIDGKIVVTTRGARLFLVGYLAKPKAAASVAPEDFERLKGRSGGPVELTTEGRRTEVRTANVVGTLGADSAAREVILSAHHDSWKGPGASDNASGVAVLLELARYFAQRKEPLPFRLRFVTFGAEEAGMLGAKAYLRQHEAELEDCELLFNMDTLGGKNFYVEMRGGVKGLPPKKGQNQLPADLMDKATHDLNARWFLLRPNVDLDASNVPEWLQQSIRETAEELGLAIRPAQQMGSDHRIFAQAGIVATNVAATVGKTHTAEDVPANLSAENLERVARLVAGVVEKVR